MRHSHIYSLTFFAFSSSLMSCECGYDCKGIVLSKDDSSAIVGANVMSYAGDDEQYSVETDSAGRYTGAYFVGSLGKCPMLYIEVRKQGYRMQHLPTRMDITDTVWLEPE